MNVRSGIASWGVLAVMGLAALAMLCPPIASKVKARGQRITSVNTVRNVSFTMTNSNVLAGTRPASGR